MDQDELGLLGKSSGIWTNRRSEVSRGCESVDSEEMNQVCGRERKRGSSSRRGLRVAVQCEKAERTVGVRRP